MAKSKKYVEIGKSSKIGSKIQIAWVPNWATIDDFLINWVQKYPVWPLLKNILNT